MMRRGPLLRWVRSSLLLVGPLGHLVVLGPLQAYAIGMYLMQIGWHVCIAWPAAIVVGYVPGVGPLVAAYAVYMMPDAREVWWWWPTSPRYLIAVFLTPLLLFWLLARISGPNKVPPTVARVLSDPTALGW